VGNIHGVYRKEDAMKFNAAAARTSGALAALFVVVYGGTNILASIRPEVPSVCFAWEHVIPFVPWMFIPYASIDLFFLVAPFVCSSDRQRRLLAWRLGTAIVIAGAFFLLVPLRLSLERQPVAGALGELISAFRGLDRPFNQFPSLHITLTLLLMPLYLRRAASWLRPALCAWFLLILASPLLTWQHHAIDILGGTILAIGCAYVFREQPLRTPVTRTPRIAGYYGAGSLACVGLSLVAVPWSLSLLWPAATLALVAAGYLGLGAGIYRKSQGRIPWVARFLLEPVLLGQRASLARYRRRGEPWNRLTPNVIIGRRLSDNEARPLLAAGVTATLDLTGEFSEAALLRQTRYLNVPILDLSRPTDGQIEAAVAFIARESTRGAVYIHCKLGYSRTAAVAGVYLLRAGLAQNADAAIARLRAARPGIIIRPEAECAIRAAVTPAVPATLRDRAASPATAPA